MVRAAMKGMGELAGVPIEPDSQTKLLDACLACEGVLGCGVPGGASHVRRATLFDAN
jgi:phosphomevalonate kinase